VSIPFLTCQRDRSGDIGDLDADIGGAFATWERSTAGAACYLRLSRLRFDLDHVVERLAVRAREPMNDGWPAPSRSTPPTPILIE
jgi:hypothetical protein